MEYSQGKMVEKVEELRCCILELLLIIQIAYVISTNTNAKKKEIYLISLVLSQM